MKFTPSTLLSCLLISYKSSIKALFKAGQKVRWVEAVMRCWIHNLQTVFRRIQALGQVVVFSFNSKYHLDLWVSSEFLLISASLEIRMQMPQQRRANNFKYALIKLSIEEYQQLYIKNRRYPKEEDEDSSKRCIVERHHKTCSRILIIAVYSRIPESSYNITVNLSTLSLIRRALNYIT